MIGRPRTQHPAIMRRRDRIVPGASARARRRVRHREAPDREGQDEAEVKVAGHVGYHSVCAAVPVDGGAAGVL